MLYFKIDVFLTPLDPQFHDLRFEWHARETTNKTHTWSYSNSIM